MIDWRISPDFEADAERQWYFPSFEMQEFLLPLINPGKEFIDEYGAAEFSTEDCRRIHGNIWYLLDCGWFERRDSIGFDSISRGFIRLSCEAIQDCLLRLDEAVELAIQRAGTLVFFGD